MNSDMSVQTLDKNHAHMRYYKNLDVVNNDRMKISSALVLTYLLTHKNNALFFYSVRTV